MADRLRNAYRPLMLELPPASTLLTVAAIDAAGGTHMCGESNGASGLDHQAGTRRIFVVHLRLDADPAKGRVAGRIQHVHSSDASHFESVDELVAFIADHVAAGPG